MEENNFPKASDSVVKRVKEISISVFGVGVPTIKEKKVFKNGGAYVVSVPYNWLEKGMAKNDELIVFATDDNELVIAPNTENIKNVLKGEDIYYDLKGIYEVKESSLYVYLPRLFVEKLSLEGVNKAKSGSIQKVIPQ